MALTSQTRPEKGQAEAEVWAQGRELLLESQIGINHIYQDWNNPTPSRLSHLEGMEHVRHFQAFPDLDQELMRLQNLQESII